MTHSDQLTQRVFRALYREYDLLTMGLIHIVTPKGTPVFTGDSLGEIARQLTSHHQPPGEDPGGAPSAEPRPDAPGCD
jgi:hypothetical protein